MFHSMKVKSKIFKGIEYVQLSELPNEQREFFIKTVNSDLIIKILISGKVLTDCIQFKDYVSWFDNVYKNSDNRKPEATALKNKSTSLATN